MKAAMISRIAEASAAGGSALSRLSQPKSAEFVTNSRGQLLHVRTQAAATQDSKQPCRGCVVYLHGLHAHCSRIHMPVYASELNSIGFHFAALDFHGHGHSEGEAGVILSYADLVDDVASLLSALYRDSHSAPDSHTSVSRLHLPPLHPQSCPFYLLGSSMGGAVSLVFAHMCSAQQLPVNSYSGACRGCILAAPAVQVKLPWFAPSMVVNTLKSVMSWTVLPLLPSLSLPGGVTAASSAAQHAVWDTDEYIAYVAADAATHHGPLFFKTLFSIFELSSAAQSAASNLNYDGMRVIAFMDPEDAVTDVTGVRLLRAAASGAASGRVTVVEIPHARHDVLSNRMDDVWHRVAAWLGES
jgi:alpha-beta hydrolase superfamily lysophospholipase